MPPRRVWLADSDNAQGLYRARMPWTFCKDELLACDIDLTLGTRLDTSQEWDAIILHRVVQPTWIETFEKIQKLGCRIAIELDDACGLIPNWNPAITAFGQVQRDTLSYTASIA